jgi:hypothetical protein
MKKLLMCFFQKANDPTVEKREIDLQQLTSISSRIRNTHHHSHHPAFFVA